MVFVPPVFTLVEEGVDAAVERGGGGLFLGGLEDGAGEGVFAGWCLIAGGWEVVVDSGEGLRVEEGLG